MSTHFPSRKFKFASTANSQDTCSTRTFQKGLSCTVKRKSITFKFKTASKAKIGFVVQDVIEVPLTTQSLSRVRSTQVHVQEFTNLGGPVSIVGIRSARTLTNNASNTLFLHHGTLTMNPRDVVLCQCCFSCIHTYMTETAVPEHKIRFKARKRVGGRDHGNNRRNSQRSRTNKVQLKKRQAIRDIGLEDKARQSRMIPREKHLGNAAK